MDYMKYIWTIWNIWKILYMHTFFLDYLQELVTISQLSTVFKETKSSHCSKDFNCDLLAPTHGVRVPIEALNMPIGDSLISCYISYISHVSREHRRHMTYIHIHIYIENFSTIFNVISYIYIIYNI